MPKVAASRVILFALLWSSCAIAASGDAGKSSGTASSAVSRVEQDFSLDEARALKERHLELERGFQDRREVFNAQLEKERALEMANLVSEGNQLPVPMGSDWVALSQERKLLADKRLLQGNTTSIAPCKAGVVEDGGLGLPLFASLPIIVFLVSLSGLFSGLTLGLMGLDSIGLQIVAKGDDPHLAECARKIMPIREKGNQLLCTLLLGNVAVNSALSILLADIASGLIGFLASTALIVIFGEILPQAACSRYALQVGALTVPIVHCLMAMMYLMTKPMSVMLDILLGREVSTIHSRTELMEMLKLQISLGAVDQATGDMAKQVAEGALSFRDKQAGEVMTPAEDSYMLPYETCLDYEKIREIFETGYSRVPVYGKDKHDYKGLLYTKDLMLADPEDSMKLGDFIMIFSRKVETFWKTTRLVECLNTFKKGGTHMGLVRNVHGLGDTILETHTALDSSRPPTTTFTILGVLTLEDVMEEILQEEIVDETDVYVDVDNQIKVSGRERKEFDLGVFNPVWRRKQDSLSREEVSGIVAHLRRICFNEDARDVNGLYLSEKALLWLISTSEVVCRNRATPMAGQEEPDGQDWVYHPGKYTETCIMVLQGRIAVRVGAERFRCEAGAFALLSKDALRPHDYAPDFGAFLGTLKVRFLLLTKSRYLMAQALDLNPAELQRALEQMANEAVGAVSRKEAREIKLQKQGGWNGDIYGNPTSPMRTAAEVSEAGTQDFQDGSVDADWRKMVEFELPEQRNSGAFSNSDF